MRISKLAKNMLKYLPVLVVLFATIIGLFIGKGLYPASDSQSRTPTQLPIEPNNPQSSIVLGTIDPCSFSIYTSLPPKCKTLAGKFIPLSGTSSQILVTPEGK
jgi:hypothetical protein